MPCSWAVEGNTTAGPIGGTDVRSALLPPPGTYVGAAGVYAEAWDFADGNGNDIPAFAGLSLTRELAGTFVFYVPPVEVWGGSVGIGGLVLGSRECGRIAAGAPDRCMSGAGDPYIELDWSRFFGSVRPSSYEGAYPVPEGLALQLGLGTVIPMGRYDAGKAQTQGLTAGNNIWDFAPFVSVTYTTPALLADGTEFSARLYWNNYLKNPDTGYNTGDLIDLDFALSERLGRWQAGVAGFYAYQPEDDRVDGVPLQPDGRRARVLQLGPVLAYDLPEYATSFKVKALRSLVTENAVHSWGMSFSFVTKLP